MTGNLNGTCHGAFGTKPGAISGGSNPHKRKEVHMASSKASLVSYIISEVGRKSARRRFGLPERADEMSEHELLDIASDLSDEAWRHAMSEAQVSRLDDSWEGYASTESPEWLQRYRGKEFWVFPEHFV